LSYITIGAILTVLAGTSFFFFETAKQSALLGYIRTCSLILGVALLAIGFGVGRIGRVAREAEVQPTDPVGSFNGNANASPVSAQQPANVNPVYTTATTPNNVRVP